MAEPDIFDQSVIEKNIIEKPIEKIIEKAVSFNIPPKPQLKTAIASYNYLSMFDSSKMEIISFSFFMLLIAIVLYINAKLKG